MLHSQITQQILDQVLATPSKNSLNQATVTPEQLKKIVELAYARGLDDTCSVLRRTELGGSGQMIADAIEALVTSYKEAA